MPSRRTQELEHAHGAGRLLTREGEWVADVSYNLRLYQEILEDGVHGRGPRTKPGMKGGRGSLRATIGSVVDFGDHVESVLDLDDGRTVDIAISKWSPLDSTCDFRTSGEVRSAP